jgi:hypothetical protein
MTIHGEHVVHGQSVQWMTDGHEKYIWWSGDGREQLFDLDADPDELHDLALDDDTEEPLAYWRKLLVEELSGREDGFSDGASLIPDQPPIPTLMGVVKS